MENDFNNTTLVAHFSTLKDPRITGRSAHKLIDIIIIAICGMLCGSDDWVGIEAFGKAK
ncbi:transposase family protein, partial [Desulfobulbus alkaliphilus]|uniref:transposase family protein n=1 Tax=Desulfobulbus alkaliphilus TaxID=869814 RepID=UPI001965A95F|nr:transposase family protein [Desulfobulbus alkaliphilus]MBM9538826.1 transposase family protein [Desulfobulbus alkaliphilus]MBM9538851.1 transposase family protein [Desulfobulbus alkaliphilus]